MPIISGSLYYNISTIVNNCYAGEEITFEFVSEYQPASKNWTGSVTVGSLIIDLQPTLIGGYPYATSSSDFGNFVYSIQSPNIIILNSSISSFDEAYQQIPTWQSASLGFPITVQNSLYTKYGDINNSFAPRFNDKLVLKSTDGRIQILTIQSTNTVNNRLNITVNPNLDTYFINNPTQIDELLIVKRLEDEQNIIMQFAKPSGETSYGFIIPEDIDLAILESISSIQSSVQNQLLSTQNNSQ